jgi:hypothetical protein
LETFDLSVDRVASAVSTDETEQSKSRYASAASSITWKVYLFLIVPITILLNFAFPNFHAPDDYDHVKRAYTFFHHPIEVITPAGRSSGAMVDKGLLDYIDGQKPIAVERIHPFAHFERPLTAEHWRAYERKGSIRWSGSERFSETAAVAYFPVLYAPQAIALEVGRMSGATVARSIFWARFANGLTAIALTALGLYLLPAGRALALLLLLLPRTLLQFASHSADPILYGLALLVISLGLLATTSDHRKIGLLTAATFISASVRPPLAAFALTPAVQALRERRWALFFLVTSACATAAFWFIVVIPSTVDRRCGSVAPLSTNLINFAIEWPTLIGRSLAERYVYYYGSFVGHYGWGDGLYGDLHFPLPLWIYGTAFSMLGLAVWQDLTAADRLAPSLRLSLAASALGSVLLMFLGLYAACAVPSQTVVTGVQGRYFIPAVIAFGTALSGLFAGRARLPNQIYLFVLVLWVTACTSTMLVDASRLYGPLS